MAGRTKIVKGYNLTPENIDWLARRAQAASTARKKVSISKALDDLLTGVRTKQERAAQALRLAERRVGVADPYGKSQ